MKKKIRTAIQILNSLHSVIEINIALNKLRRSTDKAEIKYCDFKPLVRNS